MCIKTCLLLLLPAGQLQGMYFYCLCTIYYGYLYTMVIMCTMVIYAISVVLQWNFIPGLIENDVNKVGMELGLSMNDLVICGSTLIHTGDQLHIIIIILLLIMRAIIAIGNI